MILAARNDVRIDLMYEQKRRNQYRLTLAQSLPGFKMKYRHHGVVESVIFIQPRLVVFEAEILTCHIYMSGITYLWIW